MGSGRRRRPDTAVAAGPAGSRMPARSSARRAELDVDHPACDPGDLEHQQPRRARRAIRGSLDDQVGGMLEVGVGRGFAQLQLQFDDRHAGRRVFVEEGGHHAAAPHPVGVHPAFALEVASCAYK